MTAVPKKTDVRCYVSDRVFDGTRNVTDTAKAARMRQRVEKDLAAAGIDAAKTAPEK